MDRPISLDESVKQHLDFMSKFSVNLLSRALSSKSFEDMSIAIEFYTELCVVLKNSSGLTDFPINRILVNSKRLKPLSGYILEYVVGSTIAESYTYFNRANHKEILACTPEEAEILKANLDKIMGSGERKNYGEVQDLVLNACARGKFQLAIECLNYVRGRYAPKIQ